VSGNQEKSPKFGLPDPDPQPADQSPPPSRVEALLARMRDGDRDAAAAFVSEYGPRIRRRVRQRLGPRVRRVFDSEDILSTLSRKLDRYVAERRLEAMNEAELWGLIARIASNSAVDKARLVQRAERTEHRVAHDEADPHDPPAPADRAEFEKLTSSITDPADRTILLRWLAGATSAQTGDLLGLSAAAVRKRLQSVRTALRLRADNGGRA
jgi:RNA polymerase sigma factor (sigma-70 family)